MRIALCILAGVALRLALIIASDWRIDYDEGMVGLLGLRLLRGEWVAFLPGEVNLGTLEPLLLAPLFAIFGPSRLVFRLYGLAMAALLIWTTAALARRAVSPRAALIAALFVAIAPPYLLVVSLKTWGGTVETLILGNLLLLTAHHLTEPAGRKLLHWTLAGLLAGVMFWLVWLGFYYYAAVAIGLLMAWRVRRFHPSLVGIGLALLAFLAGSAPFWLHNAADGWPSFTRMGGTPFDLAERRLILEHLVTTVLPHIVTASPRWGAVGRLPTIVMLLISAAGLLALLSHALRRPRTLLRLMLAALVLIVPFLYVISPFSRNALNPWGIDATGRYVIMLYSALPVGLALLVDKLIARKPYGRLAALAFCGLLLGINLAGLSRLNPFRAFDSPYYDRLPDSTAPLIAYLDEQNITRVWTDSGIAHVLMFDTRERILAADYYDSFIAGGVVRFPDVLDTVLQADRVALVVPVLPGQTDFPLQRTIESLGIPYTVQHVTPSLLVYLPEPPFDIAQLAPGLGYQY